MFEEVGLSQSYPQKLGIVRGDGAGLLGLDGHAQDLTNMRVGPGHVPDM